MPYPIFENKYKLISLVQAEDLMNYTLKNKKPLKLPSRAILCLPSGLATSLQKSSADVLYKQVPSSLMGMHIDLYKNQEKSTAVVSHFGIGAPAIVACMEKLRVLGVKEFISLGVVGSLQMKLSVGSTVLCIKSLRDEGCSYHYAKPALFANIIKNKNTLKLIKILKPKEVISWTTDAPFRETKEELIQFKSLGVECVDMESAALMSAAQFHGLSACCLGVVSDHLLPEGWQPQFFDPRVRVNLSNTIKQILFL